MTRLWVTLGSIAVVTLVGCSTMRVRTDYSRQASFKNLKTYAWIEGRVGGTREGVVQSPFLDEHIRSAVDSELARRGYRKLESSGSPDFLIAYRVIARERIGDSGADPYAGRVMPASYAANRPLATRPGRYARGTHRGYSTYVAGTNASYGRTAYGHHVRRRGYGGRGWYSGYGLHRYRYPHRSRHHFGFGHYGHGYGGYGFGRYLEDYLEGTLVLDIIDPAANEIVWRGWASDALDSDPDPERVRKYVTEAVKEIIARFPPTA